MISETSGCIYLPMPVSMPSFCIFTNLHSKSIFPESDIRTAGVLGNPSISPTLPSNINFPFGKVQTFVLSLNGIGLDH